MKIFNGSEKRKNFFEGWYFKHQNEEDTIAFIPGINILKNGEKSAFIQVITGENSKYISYPYEAFSVDSEKLIVKIGESIFSENGVEVNIKTKGLHIEGKVEYRNNTPIKYDIMGPFSLIPFMECNHGIVSLHHYLRGGFVINNKFSSFSGGVGYIEKDWGTSFPKKYLWLQCNKFNEKICVMVSIAEIPFMGMSFTGCIASVYFKGKEYRLATYNGVKIINYNKNGIEISRGKYRLIVDIKENNPKKLMAPVLGEMNKAIHENEACKGFFRFYKGKELLFKLESDGVGFEYVD